MESRTDTAPQTPQNSAIGAAGSSERGLYLPASAASPITTMDTSKPKKP
jgi:hypothetical protein